MSGRGARLSLWLSLALVAGCDDPEDASQASDTEAAGSSGEGQTQTSQTSGESSGDNTTVNTTVATTASAGMCEDGAWPGGDPDDGGECDDGAEDTGFGMGDDMPLPFAVYDVQQGMVLPDELVVLGNVVITTPVAGSEALPGGFERFVQELDGGPFSGLRIASSTANLNVAAVGDAVDVIGRIRAQDGYYLLEVESVTDITVLGPETLPEPIVVSAVDLLPDNPMARAYEGASVRVDMATVTDDDPCDGEFILEDAVRVDDRFMPDALAAPTTGEILASVRGVLVYATDSYELAPPDPGAIE